MVEHVKATCMLAHALISKLETRTWYSRAYARELARFSCRVVLSHDQRVG
jgi:hypothetical protein